MKLTPHAVLIGLFLVTAAPEALATTEIDSAKFASDCEDGLIEVEDHLRVQGGEGTLVKTCVIRMTGGTRLSFVGAHIVGGPPQDGDIRVSLIMDDAPRGSTIEVFDSEIDMQHGWVQLGPGCCFKGPFPGRDESRTALRVEASVIAGKIVDLSASQFADLGHVLIRDSFLRTYASEDGPFPLYVTASAYGAGGVVNVLNTELEVLGPDQGLKIETGYAGRTHAIGDGFAAASEDIVITTGTNGRCQSINNDPDVPCS